MSVAAMNIIAPAAALTGTVQLPSSKSLSNRALIIAHLCNDHVELLNLSDADDTRVLKQLLAHPSSLEDCGAGGTTFRFLLALRALQQHQCIITGSARLQERPVSVLVEVLRAMGAGIDYPVREGFAPVQLNGGSLNGGSYELDAGISSQFVSALMMIGPCLTGGLILHLNGLVVSSSYINMTALLMEKFGVSLQRSDQTIVIPEAAYSGKMYKITADWSAAVFFYAMAALRPGTVLMLEGLTLKDAQGDAIAAQWMEAWGVKSEVTATGIRISSAGIPDWPFVCDFLNAPDLAQAFAVMAAVAGRSVQLTGLSTLKHKETDRLQALKTELSAAGAMVEITGDSISVKGRVAVERINTRHFPAYDDHRMVMSLSLLSLSGAEVFLEDPQQVTKSFPGFFNVLEGLGFRCTQL